MEKILYQLTTKTEKDYVHRVLLILQTVSDPEISRIKETPHLI